MANIKKNQMANIVFPIIDGTDFATVESGITASNFDSKVTKKFFGVTHGNSTAFTSGTISKAAALVRSGIIQQTLKAAETNYDYILYSFAPANTSLAQQMLVFHTVTYDDSDMFSQLSDIGSNLLSYLTGMSGMLSDVDSQLLLNASMISDVQSALDSQFVWTSNMLSDMNSDLASKIGGITASVSASDISDIASAVWADTIGARVDSRVLVVQSLVSDVDSQVLLNASMISDIDSQLTVTQTYLTGISGAISDVESQVDLLATSNYLSAVHSDLASAIGGVTASVSASDMSDIASRVWATTEGARVDSRILVIQSLVSDVDSQLLLNASAISDIQSALDSQFVWTSGFLSDMNSDLGSKIGNVSVTLTASDISDIASAVTAAGVNLTASDMSDIASRVWSEKYNVHSALASSFGSFVTQQIQGASNLLSNISGLVSDVDSQLLLNASMISDVDSQVNLLATSNYLSQVHSDLASAVGAIAVTVTASDMSDIASRVWATTEGVRVDSRILVLQSMVSDVDSQILLNASMISDVESALDALNDPTAAAIADAVWDEPYSDHLAASTVGSRVQNIVSVISDVDSQLTVTQTYLTGISGAVSDVESQLDVTHSLLSDVESAVDAVDSQLTVTHSLVSDIDSQMLLNASMISDVDSQLTATHSLLSDVESAVDALPATIFTTQMTESYNVDGTAPTMAQALFLTMQMLTEFSINSTTLTVKKLDGSTSAATFTLDDDTSPTSLTRAS